MVGEVICQSTYLLSKQVTMKIWNAWCLNVAVWREAECHRRCEVRCVIGVVSLYRCNLKKSWTQQRYPECICCTQQGEWVLLLLRKHKVLERFLIYHGQRRVRYKARSTIEGPVKLYIDEDCSSVDMPWCCMSSQLPCRIFFIIFLTYMYYRN